MLTSNEIKKNLGDRIIIDPFSESQLNPNSYNLRLHNELLVYTNEVLDCKKDNETCRIHIGEKGFILKPDQAYLGQTVEWTETNGLIPCIDGRSSLARLFVSVHVTAGFGDIGYKGYWTLEITVKKPIIIYPNMEICQIYYFKPDGIIDKIYKGKYQNNGAAISSRLFKEFT